MHLFFCEAKVPSLELKTLPKKLLVFQPHSSAAVVPHRDSRKTNYNDLYVLTKMTAARTAVDLVAGLMLGQIKG